MFTSRKKNQSYVGNVDHDKKQLRIITVLPKGRHDPKAGTKKYTVEGVEVELEEIIVE